MSDATIKTAVQDTGLFMQDIEERLKYINRQMAIMDYNSDMDGAREEGHAVGLAEGRTQMAIDMYMIINQWMKLQSIHASHLNKSKHQLSKLITPHKNHAKGYSIFCYASGVVPYYWIFACNNPIIQSTIIENLLFHPSKYPESRKPFLPIHLSLLPQLYILSSVKT